MMFIKNAENNRKASEHALNSKEQLELINANNRRRSLIKKTDKNFRDFLIIDDGTASRIKLSNSSPSHAGLEPIPSRFSGKPIYNMDGTYVNGILVNHDEVVPYINEIGLESAIKNHEKFGDKVRSFRV